MAKKIYNILLSTKHRTLIMAEKRSCQGEGGPSTQAAQIESYSIAQTFLSSAQLLSHVQLFVTSWTAACQASLSMTNCQSLLKLMSIESVMPSNRLILCHPLLLLPSILPRSRVFSNESVLQIKWPKYWNFSFNISPSMNIQD